MNDRLPPQPELSAPPAASVLASRLRAVRAATLALAAPLSAEDCTIQSMPDASPVKWHLAHTTWFFETFVLEPHLPGYRLFNAAFRVLFNSYYNAVGAKHPRPQRGLLSRPSLAEIHAYRAHVDAAVQSLLSRPAPEPRLLELLELGLQHEQQHQELILTDILHLLSCNPLKPAYNNAPAVRDALAAPPLEWIAFAEGVVEIGHSGTGFAFDNETPRHRQYLDAFALASRPVTHAEYAAFVADGGYRRAELWLSEGWDWLQAQRIVAPMYWEDESGARVFTLQGMQPPEADAPVCHVSLFEADAYAHWAGARLPTEAEWEVAAAGVPVVGHFVESGALRPRPALRTDATLVQLFGDVWQWTQSAYAPYSGFRAAAGAIGEYNGKFMSNQYVLRGGSCATPRAHIRASYRNFFPASARWQFSGFRLARDGR